MAEATSDSATFDAAATSVEEGPKPADRKLKRSRNETDASSNHAEDSRKRRHRGPRPTIGASSLVFGYGGFDIDGTVQQVGRTGHSYEGLQMTGYSRVHAGDTFNNYHGPVTLQVEDISRGSRGNHRDHLGNVGQVMADKGFELRDQSKQTVLQFLKMLQRLFSGVAPLMQVTRQVAYLEDALGRFCEVDINSMDWTSLHCGIALSFNDKPGRLRVARENYRLFDRFECDTLVDPRSPPDFAAFFKAGRHYRMSMHFTRSEVPERQCPSCGFVQKCNAGTRTSCVNCELDYRSHPEHVDDKRVEELDVDIETGFPKPAAEPSVSQECSRDSQERLWDYERISVSVWRYVYQAQVSPPSYD